MPSNLVRLEQIVAELPETERVDIEAWGDHPSYRVRGRNFLFANSSGTNISVKLHEEEAAAVVALNPSAEPAGYGLGRHGWIAVRLPEDPGEEAWEEVREWVRTSYTLVAPRSLAGLVLDEDAAQ